MSISIGIIRRGIHRGGYEFDRTSGRVLRLLTELGHKHEVPDLPLLVVVFDLPGDLSVSDFSGIHKGRLWKKDQRLQIGVAVPSEVLHAMQARPFILRSFRDAVKMAGPRFQKSGLSFSIVQHMALIDEIELSPEDTI